MMRRMMAAAAAALALAGGITLVGQSIVLEPGTIDGSVSVAGVAMQSVSISGSPTAGGGSGSTNIFPNGASTGTYSLTVNVPQSAAATFTVSATVLSDFSRDTLQLPAVQTSVSAGIPGTADFTATPGFVDAAIVLSGATLSSVSLAAIQPGSYASTNASAGTNYRFPAPAGSSISVGGSVNLTDGRSLPLTAQTVAVLAGQTTNVTFSVTAPPLQNGSMAGTVAFTGPNVPHFLHLHASGPSFEFAEFEPPTANQAYRLDDLSAGQYFAFAYVYLNNWETYFQFPHAAFSQARPVTVAPGQTSTVDISAEQAFINSSLTLSGAPTLLPLLSSSYVSASGVFGTPTDGGFAQDQMTVSTKTFDLVVSPGSWQVQGFSLNFNRPSPYMLSSTSYNEFAGNTPIAISTGETKTKNFALALGEVTLTLSVAGGGLLSNPQIAGNCSQFNASGQQLYSYSVNAYAEAINVASGQVAIAGPAGRCTLFPSMEVGSSSISLPPVTLTVVAGASQVIDIGGPALTMTSPAAELIVPASSVTVSGKVTDDVAVASVTVNGNPIILASTNNPNDPRERQFSTSVTGLQPGPNTITTVAADTSSPAKGTSDTRIVYFDTAAPAAAFTPEDGFSTLAASVTVSGTADDDAGVATVSVNGTAVTFASTNNPAKPHEVSFSTSAALVAGPNPITVKITDISTRTASVTNTVTRRIQVPTTMTVGDASAPIGGTAALTATLAATDDPPAALAGKTVVFTVSAAGVTSTFTSQTNLAGKASVDVPLAGIPLGTYPAAIIAAFAGDADYLASSAASSLEVTKRDQEISFAAIANHTYGDEPFAISASASSNLDVAFEVVSGAASISGNVVTLEGGGPVTIRASQPGDAIYNAAPSVERSFTVALPDLNVTSITLETRPWNGHVPVDSADAIATYDALPAGVPGYAPAPKTLTVFSNVSNHVTFGGGVKNIGYHHHFAFNAPVAGSLAIRMGADFGAGGTLVIDGVPVQFRNTNMWWNGSYANPAQILSGTVHVAAGPHTIDSYGFEDGDDGPQEAQYSYLGAPYKIFTAPANEVPAVVIAGPAGAEQGTTETYTFTVTDPDDGATFSVVSLTCGANGTVAGSPVITAGGGSFDCSFPSGPAASTVSVRVKDNRDALSNTAEHAVAITKVAQTIDFAPLAGATYGDPDFALTATASSGLPVSFVASGTCSVSENTVHLAAAGDCTITASQAGDDTYAAAPGVPRTFAIAKAAAAINVTGYTGVYDGSAHGAGGTATGVGGEDLTSLLSFGATFTNAPGGTAHWTFAGNANYEAASDNAAIAIAKAALLAQGDDQTKLLGAALPAFTARYTGFIGADGVASLGGVLEFSTPATAASAVGTYPITPGGLTSDNYAITFVPGRLNVTYNVCLAFDNTKVHNSGSTIPIKLQLCSASGAPAGGASIVVHATQLVRVSTQASGEVEDAGDANPDADFRLTGTGYLFNLKTSGLLTGTYSLAFTVTGDPEPHAVRFQVK